MTTSVSTTGSISSTGIGSGLDVASIISKLMTIESAPLTDLQTKETGIQTKISAYAAVQSAISSFRDTSRALTDPTVWSATTATSADSSTVGVATTSSAAVGSYSVAVQSLAAGQSVASSYFGSSTTVVGAGTLHIDLGSWNTGNTAFTAQTDSNGVALTGTDITISSTATLADVRDQINNAAGGVTASVVTDTGGARLVLSSTATGTANAFRATSTDAALSKITYDPPNGTSSTLSQPAANAAATINGLSVGSASNSLTDVVNGLTLNLAKVNASPVMVTVAQDTAGASTAIQSFVTAYNTLSTLLETDTKYDSSTSIAGPLQADSTAVSIQRQLRNILTSSLNTGGAYSSLSQVGVSVQTDGTLAVDSTKLTTALANLSDVKNLFANAGVSGTDMGFATQMRSLTDSMLASDGLLTTRTTGLSTNLTNNLKQQDDVNDRLAATRARLTAQYTALDSKMATLSTLSDYVTQQVAAWNKSS